MEPDLMQQPSETPYSGTSFDASTIRIVLGTAGAVGEAFFLEAAKTLVEVLGVRWVLFGQYEPGNEDSAQTIVFWDGESLAESIRVSLRDSIWRHLRTTGECIYPDKLHSTFSSASITGELGAEGCVGAQLKASDGTVIGFLTILDDKPITHPESISQAISLLATRAGAELERLIARSLNERLGKIVEESVSEAYVFSGTGFLFETVNRGARENLGYSIDELRSMAPWDLKPAISEQEFRKLVEPLLAGEVESLQLETQHRRKDGSQYDVSVKLQYFSEPDNLFFASIKDVTHLKDAEKREKFLINEINHRSKNLLTIVQAIAEQTVAGNPAEMPQRLARRLAALAANQDVLVHNRWRSIPMKDLVRSQLGFVQHYLDERILMDGPDLNLQPEAAQVLGLAIHELTTNAIKHGALANDRGMVEISWSIDADDRIFTFHWNEREGPLVAEPAAKGFGSSIIVDHPSYALGATVEAEFRAGGLKYGLTASASEVLDGDLESSRAT
jgi:PAS domain S-box-containing protein